MAVVAGMFAFSCVTDTTEDLGVNLGATGQTTLTITLEETTKTFLGAKEEGIYPLYWSEGDKISVNGIVSEALTEGGSNKALFTFNEELEYPYSVLYPASEEAKVTFPTTQTFIDGTFSEGSVPMYGYAAEAGDAIQMMPLSGLLRFTVTGEGSLASLVVSAENANLSGTFAVDCAAEGELTADESTTAQSVTVSFGENGLQLTADAATAQPIYVAVPAGSYGTVTVTFYTTTGECMVKKFDSTTKPINARAVREFGNIEFVAGEGAEDGVYLIYSKESLFAFANAVSTEGFDTTYPTAKVVADIDLTGADWTSIDGFAGTFDGGNHKIVGLNAPLFGTTPAAAIKNVKLTGVNINASLKDKLYFGALVNQMTINGAVVENCSTSGTMNITLSKPSDVVFVGGIVGGKAVGADISLTLTDLVNNVIINVDGNSNAKTLNLGGVIGFTGDTNTTTLGNLTNNGAITVDCTSFSGSSPNIGGVIGFTKSKLPYTTGTPKVINNGSINIKNGGTSKLEVGGVIGFINISGIEVKNLHNKGDITIKDFTASSWFNVGGVVSYNQYAATYDNIKNEGNITISDCTGRGCIDIGGVLGTMQNTTTFKNDIINTGNITVRNVIKTGNTEFMGIGGVIGGNDDKTISTTNATLKNEGTIKVLGGDYAGETDRFGVAGIIGHLGNGKTCSNATNTGDVIFATAGTTAAKIGGLVGDNTTSSFSNSKCFANVAAFTWDGTANGTLTKLGNVGMITGGAFVASKVSYCHVGGKIGTSATVVTGEDGTLDIEVSYTQLYKNNYINYLYNAPVTVTEAGNCGYLSSINAEPDYTMDATTATSIGTADELIEWANSETMDDKNVMLTADIDMEGKTWTSVDGFTKMFEGNDHEIKNLTAPLFNTTSATIKNVRLTGVAINQEITTGQPLAALVCTYSGPSISNCSVSGTVTAVCNQTATTPVGGVIGKVDSTATLSNLTNNATVSFEGTTTGSINIGGLLGQVAAAITVRTLTNNGTINCGNSESETVNSIGYYCCVGGVIANITSDGSVTADSTTLTNNGTINATNIEVTNETRIGGVIGNTLSVTAENSTITNNGTINVNNDATLFKRIANIGGVLGKIDATTTLTNSTVTTGASSSLNINSVTFNGDANVGGIVGYIAAATTTDAQTKFTNEGTINMDDCNLAKFNFGGVVGYIASVAPTLNNLHNKGAITLNELTATGSYFNVGGVLSYNGKDGTTINNMKNEGALTITKSSATGRVDVGGVLGTNNNSTTLSGEIINKGDISCDMTSVEDDWRGVGGVIGYYWQDKLTLTDVTILENTGAVSATGTYYDLYLGGIAGKISGSGFSYSGPIKNSGNVTLSEDITLTDAGNTFVGGIYGASAIAIDNARCYCTVTGWNDVKVGMITGSARSETVKATNCYVGGKIDKGVYKEDQNQSTGESETKWWPNQTTIKTSNYCRYVYGTRPGEDNNEANTIVAGDGCGFITAIDDAEPEQPEL